MNKFYTTVLALALLAGTANAQQTSGHRSLHAIKQHFVPQPSHPHTPQAVSADREILWSSDFSNPADWTIGNIDDPNNDNWVIGTTGSSGAYEIGTIESPTAANGFALFDSDLLCGGSQNAYLQTANSIDLSAYPNVVLQFDQYYRRFQDSCFVEGSTDGTNWTSMPINDIDVNAFTPNPEFLSVNISSMIGGAATAWFRFRFKGGCDYSWMIDDVALITQPENEIVMDYGYASQTGTGFEYGRTPTAQMNPTLNVGAELSNFGFGPQTGVTVTAILKNSAGTELGTVTTNVGDIAPDDTVITSEYIDLPSAPVPTDLYTVYFTVTSDQIGSDNNTMNNSKARNFAVTEDLYSVDGVDVYPDSILNLTQIGTASFTDNTQDVRLLNYYEVHTTMTATGVEILLGSASEAGSYFIASLYDTTSVHQNIDLSTPLAESDIHVITDADIAAGKASVQFFNPVTLSPEGYFVSANLFQEGGHDLYILDDVTVPQPGIASILWLPVDEPNEQHLYDGNGTAWAVRLSSNPNVSVQEHAGLQGVSMYPNPSSGMLNINMQTAGNTTVEVFNVLGETVKTADFNGTSATLDLSGNAAGVYSVRVGNGSNFTVQRIALN